MINRYCRLEKHWLGPDTKQRNRETHSCGARVKAWTGSLANATRPQVGKKIVVEKKLDLPAAAHLMLEQPIWTVCSPVSGCRVLEIFRTSYATSSTQQCVDNVPDKDYTTSYYHCCSCFTAYSHTLHWSSWSKEWIYISDHDTLDLRIVNQMSYHHIHSVSVQDFSALLSVAIFSHRFYWQTTCVLISNSAIYCVVFFKIFQLTLASLHLQSKLYTLWYFSTHHKP